MNWLAWETMDDEIAYEIVKTLAENHEQFKDYFASGESAQPERFVRNAWKAERYHPAALRYYDENGLEPEGWLPR